MCRNLEIFTMRLHIVLSFLVCFLSPRSPLFGADGEQRFLYVAVPGVRDYLDWGGEGILVFDIDAGHKFTKRITAGNTKTGKPEAVKGICANAATRRIYYSTPKRLRCLDLATEQLVWEKTYEGGCDRMSMTPDGKLIYQPSFEGPHWHVIDAASGDVVAKIVPNSGAHNTVCGLDGTRAYLAGLKSNLLTVADTKTSTALKAVGPFSAPIRPFTVNGAQTLSFCCVNGLLGFEIGDLKSEKMVHRVEVAGYQKGAVKRHGCPSHGIGLTPDEKEAWVCDSFNSSLHIFDTTVMPPKQAASINNLRDQPGWVTFSIDGRFAYPSSGEVIETKSRKIVATLADENGKPVQSEKLLEIIFAAGAPVRAGDQFGVGRITK